MMLKILHKSTYQRKLNMFSDSKPMVASPNDITKGTIANILVLFSQKITDNHWQFVPTFGEATIGIESENNCYKIGKHYE